MRRLVLHPFLFAIHPVLFLFAENLGEVMGGDLLTPAVLAVAGAGIGLVLARLLLGDLRRAGLLVSVLALSVLWYGHVANLAGVGEDGGGGDATLLLIGWLSATAALAGLAVRSSDSTGQATSALNVISGVLVLLTLATIAPTAVASVLRPDGGPRAAADVAGTAPTRTPDIYYIVMDRYGADSTLESEFGFDNAAFAEQLRGHGFTIVESSVANYLKTAQSLASSLNMQYHNELQETYGPDTGNILPIYERLRSHEVGRRLQARGYEYVHIGSWWDGTQTSDIADRVLGFGGTSDFSEVLYDTTMLPTMADRLGLAGESSSRQRHYEAALQQFSQLADVDRLPGPKFVFVHILLPHEPYVFDRDGSYVTAEREAGRTRTENFTEQLTYTNTRILDIVDGLLAGDEDPVIILQGDEGPHPVRYTQLDKHFDWREATQAELEEKFRILNAIYMPGVEDAGLYEGITPVNTFRVIFNRYFDADLPLLPDRSYVFPNTDRLYDYTEITGRLQPAGGSGT